MLTKKELEGIAEVLAKYPDIVVVCDEVYEYLTYDGAVHTSLATLPGMYACCRVRPAPPAQQRRSQKAQLTHTIGAAGLSAPLLSQALARLSPSQVCHFTHVGVGAAKQM